MDEVQVNLPPSPDWAEVAGIIEASAAAEQLRIYRVGMLRSYPGSTHWHIKPLDGGRGTLEITLWPRGRRLWFKVQARRRAAWIDEVLPKLKRRMERTLRR